MANYTDKQAKLDALKDLIIKNKVTPELADRATQLVFGVGNPDADVMFIGEAPGKNEDLKGEPFVGAAGKFLDEMLAGIGMRREDIYITNIVKYRPPNNRDPLPEEKSVFLPYLQTQLDIIQPKLVVTLGRHSMNCFLSDLKISQVHGQPKRIRIRNSEVLSLKGETGIQNSEFGILTLVIMPLYHPAAALYNGAMREVLIEDFSRIPAILKKLNQSDNENPKGSNK